ncbi:hypothetical protein H8356DRAFT_933278 [Neocallimastix lanati (nom. inval.)]|uniref:Uncharacterized protein n=1 Tax=Neocallimastix californiae TaxID=1754190 RepID=A0A1Y1ZQP1_9FUNG|nr:hypothetical protein H8356DRAFT_933278 [Neocallimastix sp. JGI-2020a]ORY12556.1 hypothetical protein LY90DRAFT_518332 [Neocallimastix californiae]|eukprot:ORY12556.1 hypothetical protein LY90DRAFT_518332 [Neocallimastix californiae]
MIHPQLAKEMGFKIEDRPLTFTNAAGKVLIPKVTEEFRIKVKLVEERTGKVKVLDSCTDLIYKKIDNHDQRPKVFKIDGERPGLPDVDSPGECEDDSIYMVQLTEDNEINIKKEIQPTARITKIINQVMDNQKLKDRVYYLTRQFYR